MGPWHDEETRLSRRQFLANLKRFPDWHQTRYYCPRPSLRECRSAKREPGKRRRWKGKGRVREPHDIRNGYKSITEFMIPEDSRPKILSGRISPVFDCIADSAATCREKGARLVRFKFRKPCMTKAFAVFRPSVIWRWIIVAIALVSLILSRCLAFLMGYRKGPRERRDYRKGEPSSGRHKDH